MNSFTIIIRYKSSETAVLNATYNHPDGSFQITDLITKHIENPEYEIVTFDIPVNKVGREKTITADKERYFTNNRVVINHHSSGKLHVKGEIKGTVIQGFDQGTGLPKGVGLVDGFDLVNDTNDGYQFLGGVFWGLNKVQNYISKTSEKITFCDDEINYQTMRNTGAKTAFTVLFFHFPILKVKNDNDFGCHLSAGATKIDPKTRACKNIAIFYPSYRGKKTENYHSLNFKIEE